MNKIARRVINFVFLTITYFGITTHAEAVVIAQQTSDHATSLNVWQAIQELGDNLQGPVESFTFRVSTSKPNFQIFDYTAQNTVIYDKTDNNTLVTRGCATGNPNDVLRGLTFITENVPTGYQDVKIDFSCNPYTFIPGHKYLIKITNANRPNTLIGRILFGSNTTSTDYFPGGGVRYATDNGTCNPVSYIWNSSISNNGCTIFGSSKNDLYFILTNTIPPPPPPKAPVIFIPGIGGSELKAVQDIVWADQDNGHGGKYSHAYAKDEAIWVNQNEAVKLGNDDYFDVLRLKSDGQTSEAAITLTGNLTPQGYADIDTFFVSIGYVKNTNFFVFPYDWRKDITLTKSDLDNLIETAKQKSGQTQVNIVAHSMGGLVARNYIADQSKATKVNTLIELGVPHLGSTYTIKTLMYGTWIARDLYIIKLGITPLEVKDVFQNLTAAFQLLPSQSFYKFYDNSDETKPFPFYDDQDIDKNNELGPLNYLQTKALLKNLGTNATLIDIADSFHNVFDSQLNQNNGVKLYNIVGTGQPTLGQIKETFWVNWPIQIIPRYEEIFINGDNTVPLYSASLKSDTQDLSAGAKLYYVEQGHADLVSKDGVAMHTVRSILNIENLPTDVKSEKFVLEGKQLSVDQDTNLDLYDGNLHTGMSSDGEIENNIPNTIFDTIGTSKHAFIKKSSKPLKVTVTRKKAGNNSQTKTALKVKHYSNDKITSTTTYRNIPLKDDTTVTFILDPKVVSLPPITSDSQTITPIEVANTPNLDQTPPHTQANLEAGTITIEAADNSGVLQTEYSLDNGQTVQTYIQPFTVTTPGDYTLQYFSTDKLGNQELPQALTFTVDATTSSTATSQSNTTTDSSSNSSFTNSSTTASSFTIPSPFSVIPAPAPTRRRQGEKAGIQEESSSSKLDPPFQGDDRQQLQNNNLSSVLGITTNLNNTKIKTVINQTFPKEVTDVLVNLAKIGAVASAGLAFTFFKPPTKPI